MNLASNERYQVDKNSNIGQIRQFYAGKKILITGITGFFGTCILEKLLRTCLEIDNIYVLIRPKKNRTIEERMNLLFESALFDTLRQSNPGFKEKVIPIMGDLLKEDLGMSLLDRQYLKTNTDIIIHNAAEVTFSARVSQTFRINVLGTKYMLDLAAECLHLKAFIYVSSTYSNCYSKYIEEIVYPAPGDLSMIENIIKADESTPDGLSEAAVVQIRGKWPNVYTFSKSMAESLVNNFTGTSAMCAIYRPSIVVGSYSEPIPGWVANKNGPVMFLLALGTGIVHAAPIAQNTILDVVPVDMSVNSLLAATWDLCLHKKTKGAKVYNYGSSMWKPFGVLTYRKKHEDLIKKYPSESMVWFPFNLVTTNLYIFYVLHVLLHVIPAILADLIFLLIGKKPGTIKLMIQATKYISAVNYFINSSWVVEVKNTQNILIYMNRTDYEEFPFDLGRIDWNKGFENYFVGIQTHVRKESLDNIPVSKKRYQRLKILHYSLTTILLLSITYLFYKIMCNMTC